MKTRLIPGQLDLFAEPSEPKQGKAYDEESTVRWLLDKHGCTEAVTPYVHGLFAEFDPQEAFERSKCLPSLDGLHQVPGWELQDGIDYYCMYSHEIDYHTVWDRAWAARKGVSKDDVYRLAEWDYGRNKPIYE